MAAAPHYSSHCHVILNQNIYNVSLYFQKYFMYVLFAVIYTISYFVFIYCRY